MPSAGPIGMPSARRTMASTIAALLLVMMAGCEKPQSPAEIVRPVPLVSVALGGVADVAVFAGEVKPRHETDLAFRIGGKVIERRVDTGALVKRGQTLARLDAADVALQAEAASAAVAAARTENTFAQAELARYEELHRQKFVSGSALDQKRNAANAAAARLRQAEANFAVDRNQAGYATLVASDTGVITAVHVEAGQVVTAGQKVMTLARTDEREVAIAVPESRIGELKGAAQLRVVLSARPDRFYAGRVREIAPAVDPVTRTFDVRVTVIDADETLGWGMTANVIATAAGGASEALVPLASIYHQPDGKPAVWIFDPQSQQVTLRTVTLDGYREDGALVRGLRDGELVVAAGVNKLQPGQTVKPYRPDGGSAVSTPPATTAATATPPVNR